MPGQFSQACGQKVYETEPGTTRSVFKGLCNLPKRHKGKCRI